MCHVGKLKSMNDTVWRAVKALRPALDIYTPDRALCLHRCNQSSSQTSAKQDCNSKTWFNDHQSQLVVDGILPTMPLFHKGQQLINKSIFSYFLDENAGQK